MMKLLALLLLTIAIVESIAESTVPADNTIPEISLPSPTTTSSSTFSSVTFPWDIANTSVYLAASAYCPVDTYMHREYRYAGEGFIPYEVIDMKQKRNIDVQVSQ